MGWNEQLAYANDIIRKTKLFPKYGTELESISERDYFPNRYFVKHILCLDMDKYESENAKGDANKTVDAVIGIRSYNGHELEAPRMLLIELRMNYKSPKNLTTASLIGKVRHTLDILSSFGAIDKHYIFVFTDSVYELTRRWFSEKTIEHPELKGYCPWSVTMVNKRLLDPSDYPYHPYTDINSMKNELEEKLKMSSKVGFLKMMEYWLHYAKVKLLDNDLLEYNALSAPLCELWKNYMSVGYNDEEEELEAEILKEDYSNILAE